MPKQEIKAGQTDYTVLVYIPDSASTDGSGKTGLVAANLTVSYVRVETDNDVTVTDVTSSLNNLAALTTAHTDWGLLEVSSTLAPGLYRLDIADAVFASGAWSAVVYVMVTTSAAAASPMEFVMVPSEPLTGVQLAGTQPALTIDSVNISNAFQVQGLTTFHEGVVIDSDSGYGLTITGLSGAISATSVTLSGTLNVSGATTLAALSTSGTTTLNALTVTNATTLSGAVSLGSTLGITGKTTFTGAVALSSTMSVADTVTFTKGLTSDITGTLSTVTTLTNLPAITSNWLTAAGLATDAVTEIQSGLATASALSTVAGYLDTEIAAIQAKTDLIPAAPASTTNITAGTITTVTNLTNLPAITSNWLTAAGLATDAVAEIQSGLATSSALTTAQTTLTRLETTWVLDGAVYQFTANALELAPSGGGGGSAPTVAEIDAYLSAEHGSGSWESGGTGSGARSVTATVNDGATALESARVRFTKGAESYVASTNASGVTTFSLDDGTWTVTISLAGYTFTPTTMIVNGTETVTYSMELVDDVPEIDGIVNAQATCVDEFGEPAPGVVVSIRLKDTPTGYGLFGSSAPQSATSDGDGVVRFTGVIKGAVYTIKSPRDVRMYTVPATATSPHTLPNIVR